MHSGTITINVLSVVAFAPITAMSAYCVSKAAAHSLTQGLRAQLAPRGIFVAGSPACDVRQQPESADEQTILAEELAAPELSDDARILAVAIDDQDLAIEHNVEVRVRLARPVQEFPIAENALVTPRPQERQVLLGQRWVRCLVVVFHKDFPRQRHQNHLGNNRRTVTSDAP
jgi:NAD(P)-dependent dehydrogenase (short-subunit alcohol dehydrogenase family)